ncbi:MAG: phosphatase PAP2 family protein [Bacteroidales bacterium]|nr:MAG: phosphatase PAP2 family protein [Bacteroidales bacterium]
MVKITISLILLVQTTLLAQVDSVKKEFVPKHRFVKSMILPVSLGVTGIIVKETNFREYFQEKVQSSKFRTNTKIDDYLQYAPIAQMYVADIYSSKSKSEVFQQTKNLAIAEIFTAIIVQSIKHTVNIQRPNGHDYSFFSGHTSQSFTSATALYLEYKDSNKLYALSGYGFSTATGILRVTNNKHWLSDVLVGAGIGIFSARLVWYINPLQNWKPFKSGKVAVYPYANGLAGNAGLRFVF